MREVSSKVYRAVLEGVALLDVSDAETDSLRAEVARLGDWTAWDDFAEFLLRIEELTRDRGGLRQVGECYSRMPSLAILGNMYAAFATPKLLFSIGARAIGKSLFPHVECETLELADRRLMQTLTISSSVSDSPGFFQLMHGALAVAPHYIQLPSAHVEMTLQSRRAVFTIVPPPSMSLVTRFMRGVRMIVRGRDDRSVEVFARLVETLQEGNRELDRERALTQARAEALEDALRERDYLLAENERFTDQLRKAREELEFGIQEQAAGDPLLGQLRTVARGEPGRQLLKRVAAFVAASDAAER